MSDDVERVQAVAEAISSVFNESRNWEFCDNCLAIMPTAQTLAKAAIAAADATRSVTDAMMKAFDAVRYSSIEPGTDREGLEAALKVTES